jgi:AraC-like DNA-binding protein
MYLKFNPLPQFLTCSMRVFYPGEFHVSRTIPENVLLLLFSGVLRFSENGVPVSLSAGDWYIQRGGLSQTGEVPSQVPKYFYIHFSGEFSQEEGCPLSGKFSEEDLLTELLKLDKFYRQPQSSPFAVNGQFLSVLEKLYQTSHKVTGESVLAEEIAEYLRVHCTQPVDLALLSRQYSYTPDHLIRIFRKRYEMTPHQYLKMLRINHAKQLLASTNRTQESIARECGYQDNSAFYRAFVSSTGCAPGKWRGNSGRKEE